MNNELLPIGSVVRLHEGVKKLMIFGIRQSNLEDDLEYDYIGVLYPEGNINNNYRYLFNHSDVEMVFSRGYEDEERQIFIKRLNAVYSSRSFK
ncbi:MAG: hypothetical protein CVU98_07160 [Firmicutes bacterium HGW-Firmicutes-3]|jgi:hypothetical protein|nr:MAG: hypothetical protein CVU98_07160 [Firmicutes bacterium HGW-Firmicutes-3]